MKTCYTILILFAIVLISCKKEVQSKFERKWYSSNAHLIINSNKTFEYTRFYCMSRSKSTGHWKNINDTLILNSIRPKGCFFEEGFIILSPDATKHYKESIKDCMPNTGYVNFENEKFYLNDSILISKTSPYMHDGELSQIYNFKMTSYYK